MDRYDGTTTHGQPDSLAPGSPCRAGAFRKEAVQSIYSRNQYTFHVELAERSLSYAPDGCIVHINQGQDVQNLRRVTIPFGMPNRF